MADWACRRTSDGRLRVTVLAEEMVLLAKDGAEVLRSLRGCEAVNFEVEFGSTFSADTFGTRDRRSY